MSGRRLARDVVIDLVNGRLLVDGHEFPYWMAKDGPTVVSEPGAALQVVLVPLLADNVQVVRVDEVAEYADPWPAAEDAAVPPEFKMLPLLGQRPCPGLCGDDAARSCGGCE